MVGLAVCFLGLCPFHATKIPLKGSLTRRQPDGGRPQPVFMMSDDSFIREVNEELRQDQAKALWDRYGPAFIGLAVARRAGHRRLMSAGSTGPNPRPTSRATTFRSAAAGQ